MRTGQLDHKITILDSVSVTDPETGERVRSWIELCSVWAKRITQGASERLFGRELVGAQRITWSIRYREDIKAAMRVSYKGKNYLIVGVQQGFGRDRELLILTELEE